MKILVINSGSSSIKYQVLDMDTEAVMASGLVERIGEPVGKLKTKFFPGTADEREVELEQPVADHKQGMLAAIGMLTDKETGVIEDASAIGAVGHRVVHGGEDFHEPTVITPEVLEAIKANIPLAPLHNPPNLDGINVAMELFKDVQQVAVFDTAFHQSMPEHAYIYALPYEYYTEDRVRRYGFHGTSHKFVAVETAKALGKPLEECNLITVHLGNGCSVTAVENGKSVDTSLGMTPLEGLVMGTRSGDVDPAIHTFLARNKGMDIEQIDTVLNKESGLKGMCGLNDMRDIHDAIAAGDKRAKIALDVQTYRNKKYIGAYMAVLGRVDAIVFTAGIGENDQVVRELSLKGLDVFGVELDLEANNQRGKKIIKISSEKSRIPVYVLPTNEELAIARETLEVVSA
ncbi:MAG: acetate kinase [Desulfobulbus propionicus]|nr:MAG: acetate kinase [Desulfobulbus propionicus]